MKYPHTLYVKWMQETDNPADGFWFACDFPTKGSVEYILKETKPMANHTGKGGIMMRGGIEYPVDMNPNHVNSDYWLDRRNTAMKIILDHPEMEAVWDSELVPDKASVMLHALLAEKIISGELKIVTAINLSDTVAVAIAPKVARFMDDEGDPRTTRRASILAAFAEEPLSEPEAAELYSELAEIDQSLIFHPVQF